MVKNISFFFFTIIAAYIIIKTNAGCAQISMPTGGAKDTLPPVLIKAEPPNFTTNFSGNKIVLTFDEYIDVENTQQNVLISPLQKNNAIINYNFRTVTVKLRDTLLPNTTYSINFGNALKDQNEGNPFENFTYIFSTGNNLDSLSLSGKVILAETGNSDSSLIATLYRDLSDTAVLKKRPLYMARVKGDGSFTFGNLPPGDFRVYALKDGDGGKTYNSKTEAFAFLDSVITVGSNTRPVTLLAYEEVKNLPNIPATKVLTDKRLRYTTSLAAQKHDITRPLEITFNNPVKKFDDNRIVLSDTNNLPVSNTTFTLDSTRKKLLVKTNWVEDYHYSLFVPKDAVEDSSGNNLFRTDTIRFTTSKSEDYGSIVLRFKNIDLSKNPVIQFVSSETVRFSFPITGSEWTGKMFQPGEYELRVLYDTNSNGRWDPGNYARRLQPEIAVTLKQKISVRPNWDNELDINLLQ